MTHLRLVRPAGQATRPPRGRGGVRSALSRTDEEVQHFRVSLRNIARAYGGLAVVASVVGVPIGTLRQVLYRKHKRPCPGLALRVAKAGGMSMDAILSGKLTAMGRCPTCGSRIGSGGAS